MRGMVVDNYIEVNVGTRVSAGRKVLTEEIVRWCLGELLPKVRTLDITVDFLDEVDGGIDGAQWYGEDNRQHYIEINENLYYDDFVTAIMHEMVHVKQDYRKDKRPIEDREKEAYEQQEILFERWKNDINRKTNY